MLKQRIRRHVRRESLRLHCGRPHWRGDSSNDLEAAVHLQKRIAVMKSKRGGGRACSQQIVSNEAEKALRKASRKLGTECRGASHWPPKAFHLKTLLHANPQAAQYIRRRASPGSREGIDEKERIRIEGKLEAFFRTNLFPLKR